jgi:HSP20 family protein
MAVEESAMAVDVGYSIAKTQEEGALSVAEKFLLASAEGEAPVEADATPPVAEKELAGLAEGEGFKGTAAGTVDKAKESAEYTKSAAGDVALKGAKPAAKTPKEHVFKANLPGLHKEDVKVQVEDKRMLSISGQRQKEEVQKTDTWHHVERSSGQFMRKFRLPESTDLDHITGKVDSGMLTVVVLKVEKKAGEAGDKASKLKEIVHLVVGDGKGILELHIVGGKINKVLKLQLVDLNSVFGLLEDITGTVNVVLQLVNKGKGGLELQNLLGEILGTCSP